MPRAGRKRAVDSQSGRAEECKSKAASMNPGIKAGVRYKR